MNLFYTHFSEFEALPECPLSLYRRSKIRNISNPDILRKNIITEFFLLKCLLSIDSELARPLNIATTDNGKPYIPGWNHYFSISHSNDLLVIGVDEKEIGVDCQFIDPSVNFTRISERFFTSNECGMIKTSDDFFELWTKKEAYAKKMDIPLVNVLSKDLSDISSSHTIFEQYHISVC